MGLHSDVDWQGSQWISAEGAAISYRKARGYHAGETKQENDVKWVQVDLGHAMPIEAVRLHPTKHENKDGFGFPVRFAVELSNHPSFLGGSTVIADYTNNDYPNPGYRVVALEVTRPMMTTAQYVRVTAIKLWKRNDISYLFALSQIEVVSSANIVSVTKAVTAKDSLEGHGWGKDSVTDGRGLIGNANPKGYPSMRLRRELDVKPQLQKALIRVCGLGQYELTIDGRKVGQDFLTPGWTDYRKTCLYDTYDVTTQLQLSGRHAIGLLLGNGFYNVEETTRYRNFTGSFGPLKAVAHLHLEYSDAETESVGTDQNWRVSPGPVTYSHVYGGEDYDGRLEASGWDLPGFSDSNWDEAAVVDGPGGKLLGLSVSAPPIRAIGTLKPANVNELSQGISVYDLGQNASIMPLITVHGPAGSVVRITPGELVYSNGFVDRSSCGRGPAYWQYTLAGNSKGETYFSKFFYHGSRYLQVECIGAKEGDQLPTVESLRGVIIHSTSEPVGEFSCSNELFGKIYTLVKWAQRSNMVSVMTDCPHRERLGWLEQIHLNGPALRYNFCLDTFFTKTMNDMADSQTENGLVPNIAPEFWVMWDMFRDSPEWGSAFLVVAWQQYQFTGDIELLRKHFDGMARYVGYLGSRAQDLIVSYGLSDWYDIGPGEPGVSKLTPSGVTATAFYYQDTLILAQAAELLDRSEDAAKYHLQAEQIRAAFNAKFFNAATNHYATSSQCANSLALVMGIVEPTNRAAVLENIVADVEQKGLTAGDIGYRYLLRALADGDRSDVIYKITNQLDTPGYGMQLAKGATSLTEAWDANPTSSQNHFMLGQINEWFFHDLAGIQSDPKAPGFKKVIIKPAMVGDLTWVKASYNSVHGIIASEWKRTGAETTLTVTTPAHTTATVYIPTTTPDSVMVSGRPASSIDGVKFLKVEGHNAIYEISAGTYTFTSGILNRSAISNCIPQLGSIVVALVAKARSLLQSLVKADGKT